MESKQEIVINSKFGGFSLSRDAFLELRKLGCETALNEPDNGEKYDDGSVRTNIFSDHFCSEISRDDPFLIQVVKKLGDKANGMCAKLKIVEIPKNVEWVIEEYDGIEWVSEKHRTWS